jgi:serine/threonine protein kinase
VLDDGHLLQGDGVRGELPRQLRVEQRLLLRRRRLGIRKRRGSAERWLTMIDAAEIGQGPPSAPFGPGKVVAGKYRIERMLGSGGMGFVLLARHVQLGQPVALKFMHVWRAHENPEEAARFLGEARAAARIRSDHVARVSDTGALEDGLPYVVMEYLEGQDLQGLLLEQESLPIARVIAYAMQTIEGLAEAHAAGIVHRDLKPSNLFLARQADGSVQIKLLDFGISMMAPGRGVSPESGENAGQLRGSPLYMAPEQLRGSPDADQRGDIWSLGVVVYEMLAGASPFAAPTVVKICARVLREQPVPLRSLRVDVPRVLEDAVMQCLQKDPERRFQNVGALARALAPFGGRDAQAAVARIEHIVHGAERPVEKGPRQVKVSIRVPETSLTIGSFSRAVALVADVVHAADGDEAKGGAAAGDNVEEDPPTRVRLKADETKADEVEPKPRAVGVPIAPVWMPVTHTQPSFGQPARRARSKRLPTTAVLAVAGVLSVAGVVVIVVATAGSKSAHDPAPSATAVAQTPISPLAAPPVPSPTPIPIANPAPVANPTPIANPSWVAIETVSAVKPPVDTPGPAAPPRSRVATTRADGKSKPAPSAAPVGTGGFGGRE